MNPVNESICKPNKLWVDQGEKLNNKLQQELLENNDILMYSAYNEVKSVIAERFIKPLKAKIYKKITANDCKSKLVDIYIILLIILLVKKLINVDYSALTEKVVTNLKISKFIIKLMTELELLSIRIFQ